MSKYLEHPRRTDALSTLSKQITPSKDETRPIFHYTTAAGLIGILETKCLFATHAEFLNDSTECQLLKAILTPQLTAEFELLKAQMQQTGLGHKTSEQMVEVVFKTILKTIELTSPFYITSFCLHPSGSKDYENGLLSQWRGYANGGFAIQFDEHEIDALTQLETQKFSHAVIKTDQVHYEHHEKQVDLSQFQGMALATLSTIFSDHAQFKTMFGSSHLREYMEAFSETVPFLKHIGFAEENEYRSVVLCIRRAHRPDIDSRVVRDVHFRVSPRGSVLPTSSSLTNWKVNFRSNPS